MRNSRSQSRSRARSGSRLDRSYPTRVHSSLNRYGTRDFDALLTQLPCGCIDSCKCVYAFGGGRSHRSRGRASASRTKSESRSRSRTRTSRSKSRSRKSKSRSRSRSRKSRSKQTTYKMYHRGPNRSLSRDQFLRKNVFGERIYKKVEGNLARPSAGAAYRSGAPLGTLTRYPDRFGVMHTKKLALVRGAHGAFIPKWV